MYIKILALENTFTNTHIIILNDTNLDFSIDYIIIEKLREKKKIIVYVWLGSRGVKEKKSLKRDWIWYKVVKNLYIVFRFASSIEREREREWVRWNRWIQSALNENLVFSLFSFLFSSVMLYSEQGWVRVVRESCLFHIFLTLRNLNMYVW